MQENQPLTARTRLSKKSASVLEKQQLTENTKATNLMNDQNTSNSQQIRNTFSVARCWEGAGSFDDVRPVRWKRSKYTKEEKVWKATGADVEVHGYTGGVFLIFKNGSVCSCSGDCTLAEAKEEAERIWNSKRSLLRG